MCVERYAMAFDYDVQTNHAHTVHHGNGSASRTEIYKASKMYVIPRLVATPVKDEDVDDDDDVDKGSELRYGCQVAVDPDNQSYDAMSLLNGSSDNANVEIYSVYIQDDMNPNLACPALIGRATRDIAVGNQLLINYLPETRQQTTRPAYKTEFHRGEPRKIRAEADKQQGKVAEVLKDKYGYYDQSPKYRNTA